MICIGYKWKNGSKIVDNEKNDTGIIIKEIFFNIKQEYEVVE